MPWRRCARSTPPTRACRRRTRAWQEWTGSAKRLEQEIEQRSAALQTAIRSLERKARAAQGPARALALLDELIWIAVARPAPPA